MIRHNLPQCSGTARYNNFASPIGCLFELPAGFELVECGCSESAHQNTQTDAQVVAVPNSVYDEK